MRSIGYCCRYVWKTSPKYIVFREGHRIEFTPWLIEYDAPCFKEAGRCCDEKKNI